MSLIISAIGQGLMWGTLAIGLYLTFRILDFPDMTVEGSFPFGASVAVMAIVHGYSPMVALGLALVAGMVAGLMTGLLYTKGKIPVLLAGILVMTGLYSINLRILGKATVGLLNHPTMFQPLLQMGIANELATVICGGIMLLLVIGLLSLFLYTDLGQAFIATGDNEAMARSLGINTDRMKMIGLMIANGLIGLAGGMIAQNNGFADVNMGIGTIVIGLAAIIIGEVVYGKLPLVARLMSVTFGSVIYRLILLVVLQLGFSTNDFRLFSALILAGFLVVPQFKQRLAGGK